MDMRPVAVVTIKWLPLPFGTWMAAGPRAFGRYHLLVDALAVSRTALIGVHVLLSAGLLAAPLLAVLIGGSLSAGRKPYRLREASA